MNTETSVNAQTVCLSEEFKEFRDLGLTGLANMGIHVS